MDATLEKVKIRLGQYHMESSNKVVFDQAEKNPLISQLINQATNEIIQRRNYPASYTEEQIYADLKKYENNIINIVLLLTVNKIAKKISDTSLF